MKYLILLMALAMTCCQKTEIKPTFIVGDNSLADLNTTEGGYASLKINSYSENMPFGVGLTWNSIEGLKGLYKVTFISTIQGEGELTLWQNNMLVSTLKASQSKTFYLATDGTSIEVKAKGKGKFGVQLKFQ